MSAVHRHRLAHLLVGAGFLYFLFVDLTGLGIPCLFRMATGLKCPGCGVTTMVESLARLDFASAFEANPFVFSTLPFLLFEVAYAGLYLSSKRRRSRPNDALLLLYAVFLLAFAVLRNVFGF